jgi:hypothetical protein
MCLCEHCKQYPDDYSLHGCLRMVTPQKLQPLRHQQQQGSLVQPEPQLVDSAQLE